LLQGEILFTLQGGQGDLPNPRVRAEVEQILREVDVKVVDHDEKEEILTFARAA
jgi:hypothetical protein